MSRPIANAVEVALRAAGLDKMCAGCGGLNRMSRVVIVVRGDEEPPNCKLCGVPIDDQGNGAGHIGPDGRVWCRVIKLPA